MSAALRSRAVYRLGSKRSWRCAAVGGTFLAACVFARDARADVELQFATTAGAGWLRQSPTLGSSALSTSARDIGASRVRTGRSLVSAALGFDAGLAIDDRWMVPLFGGNAGWAVGSHDSLVTSIDGSIAGVRPWTTFRGDILLPGLGRRWKHRRSSWGAALRTGVTYTSMKGTVAAGTESVPLELQATTFLLQAEIEACRRLDPTTRVCLLVAPRIYEHQLLNGVSVGLRMEWGR